MSFPNVGLLLHTLVYTSVHELQHLISPLNIVLNSGQPPFHVKGTESTCFRHEIGEFEQNGLSLVSLNLTKYGCLYKAKQGWDFLRGCLGLCIQLEFVSEKDRQSRHTHMCYCNYCTVVGELTGEYAKFGMSRGKEINYFPVSKLSLDRQIYADDLVEKS